jgi:hypothetical protein
MNRIVLLFNRILNHWFRCRNRTSRGWGIGFRIAGEVLAMTSLVTNYSKAWSAARREKRLLGARARLAMERAADYFHASRGIPPMGGHVLRPNSGEAIVRVMYAAGGVPPACAWFAVSVDGNAIRELSYEEVATLETPWR